MKKLFKFNSAVTNDNVHPMKGPMSARGRSNTTTTNGASKSFTEGTSSSGSNNNGNLKCLFNIHILALEDFDLMSQVPSTNESSLSRSSSFSSTTSASQSLTNNGSLSIHTMGSRMFHNYQNATSNDSFNDAMNSARSSTTSSSNGSNNNLSALAGSLQIDGNDTVAVSSALMKVLQSRYSIQWRVLTSAEEESSLSSIFQRSNNVLVGGATEPANVVGKRVNVESILDDYEYINQYWSNPTGSPRKFIPPQTSPKGNVVYMADFKDYEYDFVCEFKPKKERSLTEIASLLNSNGSGSGSGSSEDPFLPFYVNNIQSVLEDKPLILEIRELQSSGSGRTTSEKKVGYVKLNLSEFTTPPHMIYFGVGSLNKTIMIPVKLSLDAPNSALTLTAKLRMQISSMWLTESLPSKEKNNLKQPKYDRYFLLDEKETYVVPDSLINGKTTSSVSIPTSIRKKSRDYEGTPESPPRKNSNTIVVPSLSFKKFSSNNNLQAMSNQNAFAYSPTKPFTESSLSSSIQQEVLSNRIRELEDLLKRQHESVKEESQNVKKEMDDLYSILEIVEAEKQGYCKISIPEVSLPSMCGSFDMEERLKYFVFCDLHGCNQLWNLNSEDLAKCMSMYFDTLKKCLKDNMGVDTTPAVKHDEFNDIVSDSVVCAFETAKQALKFTLLVHTKLMEVDWPDSLLSMDGVCVYQKNNIKLLFRGLRCRMGVATRTSDDTTLMAIKRAGTITQFAQGGQTLVENQVMEDLTNENKQQNKPSNESTIESLVQRLEHCALGGFNTETTLFMVIPKLFRERRFREFRRGTTNDDSPVGSNSSFDAKDLPINESSLVNVLYNRLDAIKKSYRNEIEKKVKEIETNNFRLSSLLETYKTLTSQNDKELFQTIEKQITNQQKLIQEELSELRDIQTTTLRTKMKGFETELLKLNMQLLDIQQSSLFSLASSPKPKNLFFDSDSSSGSLSPLIHSQSFRELSSPRVLSDDSPNSPLQSTHSRSLKMMHTNGSHDDSPTLSSSPTEKLNKHLLDLMEHNNKMKIKIEQLRNKQ